MLKAFVIALSFLPIVAEASLANPVSYPYPEVIPTEADGLLCYIQTSDGKILSLDKLCKPMLSEDSGENANHAIAASDNSNESASNFAAKQCYSVDSQGKPCPISN